MIKGQKTGKILTYSSIYEKYSAELIALGANLIKEIKEPRGPSP